MFSSEKSIKNGFLSDESLRGPAIPARADFHGRHRDPKAGRPLYFKKSGQFFRTMAGDYHMMVAYRILQEIVRRVQMQHDLGAAEIIFAKVLHKGAFFREIASEITRHLEDSNRALSDLSPDAHAYS